MNTKLSLNEIADLVHRNAQEKGFHNFDENNHQFVTRAIALLHEEVSELWSAERQGTLNEPCDKAEKMMAMGLPGLTNAEEEYADIIIRCLDNCKRLGIDVEKAVFNKHTYNTSRPYRHGGKRA